MRQTDLAWVASLAAVVAICGAVAGCLATALLWREPVTGWRGLRPVRPAYLVAALVVAQGRPVALASFTMAFRAVTMFGQSGLLYGLPWGAGLADRLLVGEGKRVVVRSGTGSAGSPSVSSSRRPR